MGFSDLIWSFGLDLVYLVYRLRSRHFTNILVLFCGGIDVPPMLALLRIWCRFGAIH